MVMLGCRVGMLLHEPASLDRQGGGLVHFIAIRRERRMLAESGDSQQVVSETHEGVSHTLLEQRLPGAVADHFIPGHEHDPYAHRHVAGPPESQHRIVVVFRLEYLGAVEGRAGPIDDGRHAEAVQIVHEILRGARLLRDRLPASEEVVGCDGLVTLLEEAIVAHLETAGLEHGFAEGVRHGRAISGIVNVCWMIRQRCVELGHRRHSVFGELYRIPARDDGNQLAFRKPRGSLGHRTREFGHRTRGFDAANVMARPLTVAQKVSVGIHESGDHGPAFEVDDRGTFGCLEIVADFGNSTQPHKDTVDDRVVVIQRQNVPVRQQQARFLRETLPDRTERQRR